MVEVRKAQGDTLEFHKVSSINLNIVLLEMASKTLVDLVIPLNPIVVMIF